MYSFLGLKESSLDVFIALVKSTLSNRNIKLYSKNVINRKMFTKFKEISINSKISKLIVYC